MITIALVIALFSLVVLATNISDRKNPPVTILEDAIAGIVQRDNKQVGDPTVLPMKLVIDTDEFSYDISGERFRLIRAAGNSMVFHGIEKGDVAIFDRSISVNELTPGCLIALRLNAQHTENVGKIKLRIFSHVELDAKGSERIVVKQYNNEGSVVDCEFTHPVESYLGVESAVFSAELRDEIFKRASI